MADIILSEQGVKASVTFRYEGPPALIAVNMWIVPPGDKDGSRAVAYRQVTLNVAGSADPAPAGPVDLVIEKQHFASGIAAGTYDAVISVYLGTGASATLLASSAFGQAVTFKWPSASVSGISGLFGLG